MTSQIKKKNNYTPNKLAENKSEKHSFLFGISKLNNRINNFVGDQMLYMEKINVVGVLNFFFIA